jgi:hypothetical protein
MKKTLSSFAALFLFGTFAATSGAFASTHDGAALAENVDGQTVERLEMSEEEKQRRRDECVTVYEHCYDWCSVSRRTKKDQEKCYRGCSEDLADCRARIPD